MVSTLTQLISLVSYGNDFLSKGNIQSEFNNNSVFQFCKNVYFRKNLNIVSNIFNNIIANNPSGWLELLKKKRCKKLRLHYLPPVTTHEDKMLPYMMAGFIGGGGTWIIEAIYNHRVEFWKNSWEAKYKDTEANKIWEVNYYKIKLEYIKPNIKYNINSIKLNFEATIDELIQFCYCNKLDYWSEIFKKAKLVLKSKNPSETYYHKDLIVLENCNLEEQQLLFSAGAAWVFGGMGSWNDLGFDSDEDNAKYRDLSSKLYNLIIDIVLLVTNSF